MTSTKQLSTILSCISILSGIALLLACPAFGSPQGSRSSNVPSQFNKFMPVPNQQSTHRYRSSGIGSGIGSSHAGQSGPGHQAGIGNHSNHNHSNHNHSNYNHGLNSRSGIHSHGAHNHRPNLYSSPGLFGSLNRRGGLTVVLPLPRSGVDRYGGPGNYYGYGSGVGNNYNRYAGSRYGYNGHGGYDRYNEERFRNDRYGGFGNSGLSSNRTNNRAYSLPYGTGSAPDLRRDLDPRMKAGNGLAGRGSDGLIRNYKPPVTNATPTLIATLYDARLYQARAESAFRSGDYRGASRFVNEALLADPNNGSLMTFASQANFAAGYYSQAANEIESAARLLDDNRLSYVVRNFKRFYGRDDYVNQMNLLNTHIERNPSDAKALALRGFQFGALGYSDAASRDFAAAISLKSDYQLVSRLDSALGTGTVVISLNRETSIDASIAPAELPYDSTQRSDAPAEFVLPDNFVAPPNAGAPPTDTSGFEITPPARGVPGFPENGLPAQYPGDSIFPGDGVEGNDSGTATSVLVDPADG